MEDVMEQVLSGHLGVLTIVIWTALALVLSIAGGALAGMKLAGDSLGNDLAALMGGMFGPTAAVPGVLVGLLVLALI